MLARCLSASLLGIDAKPVTVEVDLAPGLPGLQLVGLADTAIQESRERVRSALRNSGFRGPLVKVVVNLAPADLRKEGPCFDLPIALGLLIASGQLIHRAWRACGAQESWGSTAVCGPVEAFWPLPALPNPWELVACWSLRRMRQRPLL